jgi:phage-related protein
MPAVTNYSFQTWSASQSYQKWGVVYGANATDTRYFYATVDNSAENPTGRFWYNPASFSRQDNVTRLTFTQTGTRFFQQGSIVIVSGVTADPTVHYTGIALAAGSGYVDYLNPGYNTSSNLFAGGVMAPIHPYWTTGFYWLPSWQTTVDLSQNVVKTQLGEGYSQQFNPVVNANSLSWNMMFAERTDKETLSLLNFVENYGGATPFKIGFPVGNLYPLNPAVKYLTVGQPKHDMPSYGLNNVNLQIAQNFNV